MKKYIGLLTLCLMIASCGSDKDDGAGTNPPVVRDNVVTPNNGTLPGNPAYQPGARYNSVTELRAAYERGYFINQKNILEFVEEYEEHYDGRSDRGRKDVDIDTFVRVIYSCNIIQSDIRTYYEYGVRGCYGTSLTENAQMKKDEILHYLNNARRLEAIYPITMRDYQGLAYEIETHDNRIIVISPDVPLYMNPVEMIYNRESDNDRRMQWKITPSY